MTHPTSDDGGTTRQRPPWLAPAVILLLVVGVIALGKKRDEAIENPLVDLAVLTVGVFAFAAVFRFGAAKLGSPGLASFFGAPAAVAHPS